MPIYNTASATLALNVSSKWLDNLLSHNKIDGVEQAKQGIPRRLSFDAISTIEVIRILNSIGMSISVAVPLAQELLNSPDTQVALSSTLNLTLDLPALKQTITNRLIQAIEITPQPARGRPKRTRRPS